MSINAQRHNAASIAIWERQLPLFRFFDVFLSSPPFVLYPTREQTSKPLKFKSSLKLSFLFMSLDKRGGVRNGLSPFVFVFCEVHGIDLSTISNQANSFTQWLLFR